MNESSGMLPSSGFNRLLGGRSAFTSFDGLAGRRSPNLLAKPPCGGGFLASVLHPFGPVNFLLPVPEYDEYVRRDEINVVHLVTRRTQDHQVLDSVVGAIPVDMRNLQNLWNTKTTIGADGWIVSKGEFPTIHTLRHCHAFSDAACSYSSEAKGVCQ